MVSARIMKVLWKFDYFMSNRHFEPQRQRALESMTKTERERSTIIMELL